tara:strand:- start:1809 stop:3011 length:1203 start_codon:yes stop_codon:yes gene_type:complete
LRLYLFAFLIINSYIISGQEQIDSIKKEILTIGIGTQVNTFFGDISPNSGAKIFTNNKPALSFDFEKRFGNIIGLQVMVIKGKLADHNYPINFTTDFIKSNLNIIFNTDNYFDNKHNFSIYSGIGIGIINYDSKTDMFLGDSTPYTINNSFDYIYETSIENGNDITLLAPLNVGFKWKLNPYIQGRIFGTYNVLLSDNIDGQNDGNNDSYASLGFTLNYAFHKITRIKKEKLKIDLKNFDLSDEDKDGVIDLEDKCHHTPKKVKVNINGCPIDSDKDGVPDYIDVQPNSKYILHVDEQGRSLTDSLIYYRTHAYDSVDIEKNKTFSIDTTKIDSLIIDSLNFKVIKDSSLVPIPDTSSNSEINFNYDYYYKKHGILKRLDYFHELDQKLLAFQIVSRKEE